MPFPSLQDLPDPGSELGSPTLRHILLYHLSHQGSPIRLLSFSHSVVSDSLQPHDCSPPGSSVHGVSPGKTTGLGFHALLHGIVPIQESNPGFPHCRQILHCLSYQGSPRILEWVAYPFSRGSSQPKDQTGVFCIADRFFTS